LNPGEWLAVASVLAGLFAGLVAIRVLARRAGSAPEVARKSIHVGMGLTCAAFPWIFGRSLPVIVLALIAIIPLVLIRFLPVLRHGIGSSLHAIKRPSYGEVLFAPAVALVFTLADGDRVLYLIPILILTMADAAGALVGTRWGKRRYGSGQGFKTVEGSAIFCLVAFLCAFLPLVQESRVDVIHALWIGLILAILAMMAEGFSDRGFDNLVLPVGCFFVLGKLLPLEMPSLVGRFVVLAVLSVFVFSGSRWSTLNGGALLGSVLLGYGCAVLADWRFAIPPAAVFICHIVTTRKHGLTGKFDHRLDAVLSLTIASLPWVLAVDAGKSASAAALAGVSLAMGAQLSMLDTATRACLRDKPPTPLRSPLKGFVIASLPGLACLWPEGRSLLLPAATGFASIALATWILRMIHPLCRWQPTALWITQGFLALAASLPALLIGR